jgi:hypothetical protein
MDLLVLGNSDTAGLFSGGDTWTQVLRQRLNGSGADVNTVTEIRFSPNGAGAAAFAERKARELESDVIILPVGTFAFTVGFVWVRVRSLFGSRVAGWYRRIEDGFDRRTRMPGAKSSGINRFGRRAVRAVLGAEAMVSAESLAESYCAVLRSLARVEEAQVVVMVYPPEEGPYLVRGDLMKKRSLFLETIEAEAARHRYPVVRAEDVFSHRPDGAPMTTPDGFHLNAEGHRLLGEAMAGAVR